MPYLRRLPTHDRVLYPYWAAVLVTIGVLLINAGGHAAFNFLLAVTAVGFLGQVVYGRYLGLPCFRSPPASSRVIRLESLTELMWLGAFFLMWTTEAEPWIVVSGFLFLGGIAVWVAAFSLWKRERS